MSEVPATRRSRLVYLRISTSVFFGLLTVALCVLWVRSYFVSEWAFVQVSSSHWLGPQLLRGQLIVESRDASAIPSYGPLDWLKLGHSTPRNFSRFNTSFLGFGLIGTQRGSAVVIPLWFLASVTAVLAATRRLSWRFSLRTLLIATTLVAVLLGLGVWVGR